MFFYYYIAVAAGSAVLDAAKAISNDEEHPWRYYASRALVAPIAAPAMLAGAAIAVYNSGLEDADPADPASHKTDG